VTEHRYPRPSRSRRAPSALRVAEVDFANAPPRGVGSYLLDSHVWLWLLSGATERLTAAVLQQLTAGAVAHQLAISDASAWELMTKAHAGRLQVGMPATAWMARALQAPGIRTLPLSLPVMLEAAALPEGAPRDPFDRALMATARMEGMTLVTADRAIVAWAEESGELRVLAA
jgi:PIN domain nuclease of toxin-antitoxin system